MTSRDWGLAAAADHLTFVTNPVDQVAGTLSTIRVEVRDAFENVVYGDMSSVTLSLDTGVGTFTGVTTMEVIDGVADNAD